MTLSTNTVTAESIKATIWATAEPGTGIIAASIAILRPLFRDLKTQVRNHASAYHSRKASRGTATADPDDDTIALTSQFGTKTRIYASHTEDPWSPTAMVSNGDPKRVMSLRKENGKWVPEAKGPPVPPKD